VTDRAWRTLRDMNSDQCLIFTGESGSGKTEAMKLSLQYLAAITGKAVEGLDKGHLISKADWCAIDSPKNRTKQFVFFLLYSLEILET
jgi:ABC-type lipoprotein export system ATPase subunit